MRSHGRRMACGGQHPTTDRVRMTMTPTKVLCGVRSWMYANSFGLAVPMLKRRFDT
jgi:hypothetical protein